MSFGQIPRQKINYLYVNETLSVSEHRAPNYYFQQAMVSFPAYCVLFTCYTFFTGLGIGGPLNVGGLWL